MKCSAILKHFSHVADVKTIPDVEIGVVQAEAIFEHSAHAGEFAGFEPGKPRPVKSVRARSK